MSVVVMHIQMMCKLYYNLIIAICSECSLNQLPNSFTLYNTGSSRAVHVGVSEKANDARMASCQFLKLKQFALVVGEDDK